MIKLHSFFKSFGSKKVLRSLDLILDSGDSLTQMMTLYNEVSETEWWKQARIPDDLRKTPIYKKMEQVA